MIEKFTTQYGERPWQGVNGYVVSRHMRAPRGVQSWAYSETGNLGSRSYRIDIKHDFSHHSQGSARISVLSPTGWQPLVDMFGTELPEFLDVNNYRRDGTADDFAAIVESLRVEAAELLFRRESD